MKSLYYIFILFFVSLISVQSQTPISAGVFNSFNGLSESAKFGIVLFNDGSLNPDQTIANGNIVFKSKVPINTISLVQNRNDLWTLQVAFPGDLGDGFNYWVYQYNGSESYNTAILAEGRVELSFRYTPDIGANTPLEDEFVFLVNASDPLSILAGAQGSSFEGTVVGFNLLNQSLVEGSAFLPVELIDFTAHKADNNTAILSWETASELNNDFFEVQRSADAKTFFPIGKVQGNGTTNEPQEYGFTDRAPLEGINYYRLKQVDYNGAFEYSHIASVDFSDGTDRGVDVFPNPTTDYITISSKEVYNEINILNSNGQLVRKVLDAQFDENQKTRVNVADLHSGIFHIELIGNAGVETKQFIKIK